MAATTPIAPAPTAARRTLLIRGRMSLGSVLLPTEDGADFVGRPLARANRSVHVADPLWSQLRCGEVDALHRPSGDMADARDHAGRAVGAVGASGEWLGGPDQLQVALGLAGALAEVPGEGVQSGLAARAPGLVVEVASGIALEEPDQKARLAVGRGGVGGDLHPPRGPGPEPGQSLPAPEQLPLDRGAP